LCVDRRGVGAFEAVNKAAVESAMRGQPVGAVDVEPYAVVGAHVGDRVERVDGTGKRRTRGRDDRQRRYAVRDVTG
jgi:hypothetical protein